MEANSKHPVLEAIHCSKSFSMIKAFEDVSFDLFPGEIHCIIGNKGSGKTSFIKVLSGVYAPDAGVVKIDGVQVRSFNPDFARRHGIQTIYSGQYLMPDLTVAENICMGDYVTNKAGFLSYKKLKEKAKALLDEMGLEINPAEFPSNLTASENQIVQIARALAQEAKILIMDEPANSLNASDVQKLLKYVKLIATKNIGVIYISTNLDEIMEIADRVSIFRNGRKVACHEMHNIDMDIIMKEMMGWSAGSTSRRSITNQTNVTEKIGSKNLKSYLDMAIDYIENNLADNLSPKEIAKGVHLSAGYLMLLFRNYLGKSVMEYTYIRRIEKSKALLLDTLKTISEIASEVGIPNSQYFCVLFKKNTQMTPKEYRNSFKSKNVVATN
jgi:ABC-type sugar transport system ATPase subunit